MKLMLLFSNATGLSFQHSPGGPSCGAVPRREPGICFAEQTRKNLLPTLLRPPRSLGALSSARLVYITREPLEVCVSAYQYHLHANEPWLRQPRGNKLAALARGMDIELLPNETIQHALNRLDERTGLLFECQRSLGDQIKSQAEFHSESLARGAEALRAEGRIHMLRMEETKVDFDGTTRRLYEWLLLPSMPKHARGGDVRGPSKRVDREVGALVAALVAAAAHLDSARHKLGDHLSDVRSKRRLRALLLNHTTQSEKLARYRALTGYPAAYAAFCDKYGLPYADQARADGISL